MTLESRWKTESCKIMVKSLFSLGVCCKKLNPRDHPSVWRRVVQFDRFRISAWEFPLFMNRCWVVFVVIARTLSCPSVDCGQFARSRHRGPRCQVNCLDESTPHESPEKKLTSWWLPHMPHRFHPKSQVSVEHSVLDGHWIALEYFEYFEPLNWQENSSKLDVFQQLFPSNYPSNIMDTIMEYMESMTLFMNVFATYCIGIQDLSPWMRSGLLVRSL